MKQIMRHLIAKVKNNCFYRSINYW